jgi:ribosomal-protein-serine acetyltransferase
VLSFQVSQDIHLRILELRHAAELFHQCLLNREYLAQWLPWANHTNHLEDSQLYIQSELDRFANNRGFSSGIFYQDQLVGSISVHEIDWINNKTSLGYWLGAAYQGKGIMTASCIRLIHYLIFELKLNRIEIRACSQNTSSRAIPGRLGFKHEGTIRQAEWLNNQYYHHEVYGIIAEDWKKAFPQYSIIRQSCIKNI